jgi:hypothetical protein
MAPLAGELEDRDTPGQEHLSVSHVTQELPAQLD